MTKDWNRGGKGILKYRDSESKFDLRRYLPSNELSGHVKHYWIIHWDLTGHAPYSQTVLSHPNVNMVFEDGGVDVFGVSRMTSVHVLKERGAVLGVKFMPGGFYPFWGKSVQQLLERSMPASEVFGENIASMAPSITERLLAGDDEEALAREVDAYLLSKLPERDLLGEYVNVAVDLIASNRELMRVQDVADKMGSNARTLQRLFNRYIGVSPKWVIQRYRLHEAAELMESGAALDWARLALELGYYDQAHFIKDFKGIVGKPPEGYMRTLS